MIDFTEQDKMEIIVEGLANGDIFMNEDGHTKRINLDEIEEMRWSEVSLMPEGLLLGLSDQEVADLLAYLRSL